MTIVNSFIDKPYHFPHTLTLFQPSKGRYEEANLAKDENGLTDFISWYKNHNRKTVVSVSDEYGGNISNLSCLCAGSYELELSTYSPTGIVIETSEQSETVPLNVDKFREIRASKGDKNTYRDFKDENGNIIRKYVFDNSILDTKNEFA
jgi:hypothetical protein